MNAHDTINSVKSRLETVEKSAFNIALLCAYGTGVTIPEYTDNKGNVHGEATCDKPIKQNDYIKLVGRSKATLSRWIKAMNLIIENNRFNDFATGLYPFSYEKVIAILENKEAFSGYIFKDLIAMTVDTLEAMTAGLPVIVPTEGGIAEMVDDAVNGYKIDVADLDCIGDAIKKLLTDKTKYIQMAENALLCAKKFNADDMIERVEKILAD